MADNKNTLLAEFVFARGQEGVFVICQFTKPLL
jgi:hypothetical protein